MKQILVATDFSSCASNAMEYAVDLAKILGTELCAIHAIHPTEGIDNSVHRAIFIEDYYNSKKQALATWAAGFVSRFQYKDVKISTVCEVGTLSNVLTKHISENDVELLIMGSMGSTGISGLFGSNVSTMIEKTKIPTLVIPLESKFSSSPVITLATDFATKLSVEDVNGLNELISAFKSETLTVVNVIETAEIKTNEDGEAALKEVIKGATLDFRYIQEDSAKEGIMNFITSNNTDILCLVKHHHNIIYRIFNRSTVNQVMNKTIKAVLILHE